MAGLESHYRKVLSDESNFKKLIEGLGFYDPLPLLVKYNGLSSIEGSELKASLRGKLSKDRNPVIIKRVLQKDSITSYTALSKVVQFKVPHIWEELFASFAKGTHGTLSIQPMNMRGGGVIQPAADQPDIVWLCPKEQVFELARTDFVMGQTPLKGMISSSIKYYELPYMNDYGVSVWLCCPPDVHSIDIYKLYQTYNKTKYFILSDTCMAIKSDSDYQLGHICVSKMGSHSNRAFTAIIEHKTEEWKLENNEEDRSKWFCSEDKAVMFNKKIGESCTDNSASLVNSYSYNFHKKSDEAIKRGARADHLSILMATEDDRRSRQDTCCFCKELNCYHVVQYSYRVISELANLISNEKCRSGRNPSF